MVVLDVICRTRVHEAADARRAGCVCPVDWGKKYQRPRTYPGVYVPGRGVNRCGPRRQTVTEPDWAAVDRALGGDRSLTLAVADRYDAIDRLDQLGLSARQIAVRLGVTMRTVQRRRAERRTAGAAA